MERRSSSSSACPPPPPVAERIERPVNEFATAFSSNPDEAMTLPSTLDLSFSGWKKWHIYDWTRKLSCSLLDLPTVVESYKTYDDSVLIKTANIGQMIMVREEDDPGPEGVEYKHGLTPPMRDARRGRFRREPDLNLIDKNASVIGSGEGGDRKKATRAPATKPNDHQPAANGEEAEPERSDSDEPVDP
ncbi:hypothetical protein GUJ93_ZPchr0007g3710 [Zizania palustris]|uniref:TAFII55 protein conserved region domain-containing protein n=1 Tax=Zizania palustris TaxID=103762 RepID=A0A8J5SZW6_ZIZPA|nr:hypothetical protein GUJ93_ZPchr0007g3710 [Zizania palustris]